MKRPYFPQLDGFRAFAVGLVLLAHSAVEFTHVRWFELFDRYGSLGVKLFFVLSGYLITNILLDTKDQPRFFVNFFSRRGLRIYPLYYAVLAVVAFSGIVHSHGVHWWVYILYLSNLFYGHATQPAPLGPTWSLAVEEQFYLVWPFVVWALSRRNVVRLSISLIVLVSIARFVVPLPPHNTLFQLDALSAGALLACRADWLARWRRIAMGFVFLLPLGVVSTTAWIDNLSQTVQMVASASLLILLLNGVEPVTAVFRNAFLQYVGRISYGIYLLHSFIFGAFLSTHIARNVIKSGSAWKAILCLCVEYILVLGLATASFYLLERPFLRMKRFFSSGEEAAAPSRRDIEVATPAGV